MGVKQIMNFILIWKGKSIEVQMKWLMMFRNLEIVAYLSFARVGMISKVFSSNIMLEKWERALVPFLGTDTKLCTVIKEKHIWRSWILGRSLLYWIPIKNNDDEIIDIIFGTP